jgi:hypothetical protein
MMRRFTTAVLMAGTWALASGAWAGSYYADGNRINLGTVRGAIATASANLEGGRNAQYFLRSAYNNEIRWNNSYGPAWYKLQLPQTYKLSQTRLGYYDSGGISRSVGYAVKVSLDGATWTTVAGYTGAVYTLTSDEHTSGFTTNAFAPVDARYILLDFAGHNGGETNGPIAGSWSQLILRKLQFYGPNTNVPVSARISLAQSTWAGGTATFSDPVRTQAGTVSNRYTTIAACPDVVDDYRTLEDYYPNVAGLGTNSPAGDPLPAEPSRFYVTLNDLYHVEAAGWSSINDARCPKDVDIYTSPDDAGGNWTLQRTIRNLPNAYSNLYYEAVFSLPAPARRVRFDILNGHNGEFTPHLNVYHQWLSELFVYGAPPPLSTVVDFE